MDTKYFHKGATLSGCGKYRFKLWRIWDDSKPLVLWILHNPSTADQYQDDPTIRRITAFTKAWGYGGFYVGNLFPYRATNPKDLQSLSEPELYRNPENYNYIQQMYDLCELKVLAYGVPFNKIGFPKDWKGDFHYLKLTKQGFPCHPLYLKSDLKPIKIIN